MLSEYPKQNGENFVTPTSKPEISTGQMGIDDEDSVPVFDVNESEVPAPVVRDITYFGTDFDVHGLVRRLDESDIVVPTFDPDITTPSGLAGFQRRFVWTKPQMDRFIESLLLGFPVPGIFLVQEPDQSLLVLDGQQRLRTLRGFYRGIIRDRGFRLDNVEEKLLGLTYETLDPDLRRSLDNTFLHATIIRYESNRDSEAVYQIFERLNTGGTNLQPQEIRVALFHGPLVSWIRSLNDYPSWRELFGPRAIRLKDQELILRFFALFVDGDNYTRPLKTFLNSFLEEHRFMNDWPSERFEEIFKTATDLLLEYIGKNAFRLRSQINAAVCESVMIGVASRLSEGPIKNPQGLPAEYRKLTRNRSDMWRL